MVGQDRSQSRGLQLGWVRNQSQSRRLQLGGSEAETRAETQLGNGEGGGGY